MNTFCTIITADYFPKAATLYKSIKRFNPGMQLQVLIADDKDVSPAVSSEPGINIIAAQHLRDFHLVKSLYEKYAHRNIDYFRWSMKPVFMLYLLEHGFEKVLYIDCDMFFFSDYQFLFLMLNDADILLTPNWTHSDPNKDEHSFIELFTSGLFSAGFIGANKQASAAMQWWADACHFKMGFLRELGIRDDQKYLDIFPVKFEKTHIIRHRGCNIGSWNFNESERVLVNGTVLINGQDPVVFIHFDEMLVQEIMRGHDKLLYPYLEEYTKAFDETGVRLGTFLHTIDKHADANVFVKLKWKLKLRTRIKSILYRLMQRV